MYKQTYISVYDITIYMQMTRDREREREICCIQHLFLHFSMALGAAKLGEKYIDFVQMLKQGINLH